MQAIETEVKFRVHDGPQFEHKLESLGFTLLTPRTFERNTLYDTSQRMLRNARQLLRLRQYGSRWTVTHKAPPADDSLQDRYKRRIETETQVADGEALAKIFEQLGLEPIFVYEKWRSEWADPRGHCVLDETPLGLFAELEGPEEWIASIAHGLDVEESGLIKLSYGRLFELWRERTGSGARHLTFAEIPPEWRKGTDENRPTSA